MNRVYVRVNTIKAKARASDCHGSFVSRPSGDWAGGRSAAEGSSNETVGCGEQAETAEVSVDGDDATDAQGRS